MYKQVILIRADLKLSKGKMAAQAAHASVESALRSDKKIVEAWRSEGMKKTILKVADKEELLSFKRKASNYGLKNALITDAGKTHIMPGTKTCLGIGPDKEEKIDKITGELKLMS